MGHMRSIQVGGWEEDVPTVGSVCFCMCCAHIIAVCV